MKMYNKHMILMLILLISPNVSSKIDPLHTFKASDTAIEAIAMSPNEKFIVTGTNNASGGKKFTGFAIWYKDEWNDATLDANKFYNHKIPGFDLKTAGQRATSLAVLDDNITIVGADSYSIFKYKYDERKFIDFTSQSDSKQFITNTANLINFQIPTSQDRIIAAFRSTNSPYVIFVIYDIQSGLLLYMLKNNITQNTSNIAISPNGDMVGAKLNGQVRIWYTSNLHHTEQKTEIKELSDIYSLSISKKYIATGSLGKLSLVSYCKANYFPRA